MRRIEITIPGEPIAKGRPRFRKNGHTYTPGKTQRWEALAKWYGAQRMCEEAMLEGALSLSVFCYFSMPKNFPAWKRKAVETKYIMHIIRPDADNVLKIVGDALNGIVWRDDAMIAHATIDKMYTDTPRVEIDVSEMTQLHTNSTRVDFLF